MHQDLFLYNIKYQYINNTSGIICRNIEYAFTENVYRDKNGWHFITSNASWSTLFVKEKPVYESNIKQADAGQYLEETVTAVVKYNVDLLLKSKIAFPLLLRLTTDDNIVFYVGTSRYPCIAEVQSNRIDDTFTFKTTSEA